VTYRTLSGISEAQYRVLGSRHIGMAFHVKTENEIKEILDRLQKEHHDATHVCYAWRLGWDKSKFRLNDDGEPSGTAGKPIYGQIQSADLTNVLVAVIRYFGGTKLGTGGLIDAYKTASAAAIDAGNIIEKPVLDLYDLKFTYERMPVVMKKLKELNMEKVESIFETECSIRFFLSGDHATHIVAWCDNMHDVELIHLDRL
jgi:uncharacterized YigZ family protein